MVEPLVLAVGRSYEKGVHDHGARAAVHVDIMLAAVQLGFERVLDPVSAI